MLVVFEYYLSKLIKKAHFRSIIKSKLHKTSRVCAGSHLVNVEMDKYSDVGYDCTIIHTVIGAFCSLGTNITIGGAKHTVDWVSTSPVFNENKDHIKQKISYHKFDLKQQTTIGNDVWIGDRVLIKAGVIVGDGAIIGMGSVVTKDIPPYEIWGGNPAKLLRKRFNDDIIRDMKEICWWKWDDDKIMKYSKYFTNPSSFIEKVISDKNI